ncbi:putative GPI-anchored protein [Hirschfeldia incana]|nr:putative GPI-anchored protein [Hirschfeldia incana]KAJ0254691.1 putative GPI-anchored protein [Hirschfeldia incana]
MTQRALGFFLVVFEFMVLLSLCSSEELLPKISPDTSPRPFLPFIAPSPMVPFINTTLPKLSGLCSLNFTASEGLIQTTSHNCWTVFAPLLANVMCCPQLDATLTILLGKASKETGLLALNRTQSKHCLLDLEKILVGKGASSQLRSICSLYSSNLTASSCPVIDVDEFESNVDTSKLLLACEKVDPVKECCEQACQNAIVDAATNITLKASEPLTDNSVRISDCKNVVHRWLATKLEPSQAKETLRGLANCKINRVCPLVFPDMRDISGNCSNGLSNQTGCCSAMESYVSHLQKQALITNLQALDCATSLGTKLQKLNITKNVFNVCQISLKDFSLQVGSQESGCLLPSLPSDAIFDQDSGISFTCDLNDNIAAPWPSSSSASLSPASNCEKPVRMPALPAAASSQPGLYNEGVTRFVIFVLSVVLVILLLS